MDSSDNNELFADSEDDGVDKEQQERQSANLPPPSYVDDEDFKDF